MSDTSHICMVPSASALASSLPSGLNATAVTPPPMSAFDDYATYGAQQLPYIWAPIQYAIQAVNSKLHGVSFNALYTLLPEYWHFTK